MAIRLTNDRSHDSFESPFTHREAVDLFHDAFSDNDSNWLWYWIHKAVRGLKRNSNGGENGGKPTTAVSGAIQFLCDSFLVAIGRGLKRPMIRLHYRDQRFKIYLSAKGTLCVKTGGLVPITVVNAKGETVEARYHRHNPTHPENCRGCTHDTGKHGQVAFSSDPTGDEAYMGCLLHGRFLPATEWNPQTRQRGPERPLTETEKAFLAGLEGDPIKFMAQCSKDMDRCCYCNQPLEDPRSKFCGYGEICAKRWGLAWGDARHMESAPTFAKVYDANAAGMCQAVREHNDEVSWGIFNDFLTERGLPPVKMPEKTARVPRADSV